MFIIYSFKINKKLEIAFNDFFPLPGSFNDWDKCTELRLFGYDTEGKKLLLKVIFSNF